MIKLYGIPNCDTMKKARTWLNEQGIEYDFHNYKKDGLNEQVLRTWIDAVGWEVLLNKRGMMWRKVAEDVRTNINEESAVQLMLDTNSIIKRPVLDVDGEYHVGFKADQYQQIFNKV